MTKDTHIETFFYFSSDKSIISVFSNKDFEPLYRNECFFKFSNNEINLEKVVEFFDENIFKIEKKINQFVKNINLIIDDDIFLHIDTCIKENIYNQTVSEKDQIILLNHLKNDFKKNYPNFLIIHFIINKYIIDGRNFDHLENNINAKNFCLETTFICLLKEYKLSIDKIFKKYQISINKLISAKYLKKLFRNHQIDECEMAYKLQLRHNQNEVVMTPKNVKNPGFFERFFYLFD